MNSKRISYFLPFVALLLCLGGCGTEDESASPSATTRQVGASLAMKAAFASGETVGGVDLTLQLPNGVEPLHDSATGDVGDGVVTLGGGTSGLVVSTATYTAPSGGTLGTIHIFMVAANGFGVGEFLRLNLDITTETTPDVSKFSILSFEISDLSGNVLDVASSATVSSELF